MRVPRDVFVFVDFNDFLANHNYMVGSFFAGIGPAGAVTPFGARNMHNSVEAQGESIRRVVAPTAPSRLGCLFAFETLDECVEASSRHGWPIETVRRASVQPVTAIRTNMELVTVLNGLPQDEHAEAIWHEYWSARSGTATAQEALAAIANPHQVGEPLWEWLLTGRIDFDKAWTPQT